MMYDLARTERLHRAINAETTTGALLPKRCACGKAAHATAAGGKLAGLNGAAIRRALGDQP